MSVANKIMEIQLFLTYFINFVALSSILLFILDFSLFLAQSWHQLKPSDPTPDFYQQVKDVFWNDDTQQESRTSIRICTT